jgi:hypothetical protein
MGIACHKSYGVILVIGLRQNQGWGCGETLKSYSWSQYIPPLSKIIKGNGEENIGSIISYIH